MCVRLGGAATLLTIRIRPSEGVVRAGMKGVVEVECDVETGSGDGGYREEGHQSRLKNSKERERANEEERHVQAIPYLRPPPRLQATVLIGPAGGRLEDRPHPGEDTDPPHPPANLVLSERWPCSHCWRASGDHRGRQDPRHDHCLNENHCRSKKSRRGVERRTDLMLQSAACSETETRRQRRRPPSRSGLSAA